MFILPFDSMPAQAVQSGFHPFHANPRVPSAGRDPLLPTFAKALIPRGFGMICDFFCAWPRVTRPGGMLMRNKGVPPPVGEINHPRRRGG
jgi:hypothetical protein